MCVADEDEINTSLYYSILYNKVGTLYLCLSFHGGERDLSYPELGEVELVEHHGEAHEEGGLEAPEVRQLGVEHEVEHLHKGEDEEEEDEEEAGQVGPAAVQREDEHGHLQVEL